MKFPILRILILQVTATVLLSPGPLPAKTAESHLRGIVLVVADGTSQELLTAARRYAGGAEGRLVIDDYPASAFVNTASANDMVTDSAAAATAIARGIKADNQVIGMASATSRTSPPSLLDLARKQGWSTAVVTDDSVTGATPAPFLAECPSRKDDARIAHEIISQMCRRADIVMGGGSRWFHDMSHVQPYQAGEREAVLANEALLATLPVMDFCMWDQFKTYAKAGNGLRKPILGTFSPGVFPYQADGMRDLRLREMTEGALDLLLKDPRPFFLFVEAALPDKACHENHAKRALREVLEFDATMAMFRERLPPDVLVVATTDHSTGGFAFSGPVPSKLRGEALLADNPVTKSPVMTWATGPGGPDPVTGAKGSPDDPLSACHVQPAAIHDKAARHTGGDVWLVATGPGSEAFHGRLDNTRIHDLIAGTISGQKKTDSKEPGR